MAGFWILVAALLGGSQGFPSGFLDRASCESYCQDGCIFAQPYFSNYAWRCRIGFQYLSEAITCGIILCLVVVILATCYCVLCTTGVGHLNDLEWERHLDHYTPSDLNHPLSFISYSPAPPMYSPAGTSRNSEPANSSSATAGLNSQTKNSQQRVNWLGMRKNYCGSSTREGALSSNPGRTSSPSARNNIPGVRSERNLGGEDSSNGGNDRIYMISGNVENPVANPAGRASTTTQERGFELCSWFGGQSSSIMPPPPSYEDLFYRAKEKVARSKTNNNGGRVKSK